MAPCVAALRLNSTPVIACYHRFILYLQTFCGVSDCILNKNIIIIINSFVHSGYFYGASSRPLLLRSSRHSTDIVLEFHAEAPQETQSEGLAQSPYIAAR